MREAIVRILAAGAVAALGAGPVLAPQASARASGFVLGRATFNRLGFPRFVGQPLVRPGQAPPVVVSGVPAAVDHTPGFEPARHHRRFFGFGFPLTGIGVSYGPYDGPIVEVGTPRPSGTAPVAQDGDRSPVSGGGCRMETRLVASEAGGEQPINITWCRKG